MDQPGENGAQQLQQTDQAALVTESASVLTADTTKDPHLGTLGATVWLFKTAAASWQPSFQVRTSITEQDLTFQ